VLAAALVASSSAVAAPGHTGLPGNEPWFFSPNIMDGAARAIYDTGSKIIAVGDFTTVQNRNSTTDITRNYILAFDKATGVVDTAFAPTLDNEASAVIGGPTAGTVLVSGKFNTVNGVTRRKVAMLNVSNGSLVTSFAGPAINGAVNDIVLAGSRVLLGGIFTVVGGQPRNGLASLNATTGAWDTYLTTALTVNHNWTAAENGAKAGVGPDKLAISPDGTQLVVIGNFKNADGVLHDQVLKLDLGPTAATIADWNTDDYQPRCAWWAFDSWVRDVAFSPDGSYFVVVGTGAPNGSTLCDAAARWEANATGPNLSPTWVDWSGGDTILAVTVTEVAVYIGGHMRWMNNRFGGDSAQQGAVGRASLAALDPVSGRPMAFNPGRHPRGVGIVDLYATPEGLWIGHDQKWMGDSRWRRERIAFLELATGYTPHSTTPASLPGNVYQAGGAAPTNVLYRVNAGGALIPAIDGGPDWTADSTTTNPLRNTGSNAASWTAVPTVDGTVPATTPSTVYSTERWDPSGSPEMQWDFPVTAGTTVEVRLYLANRCTCTQNVGQRRFNVSIDGTAVLSNFDIVAAVGHDVGTMRSFNLTSDGVIDIDFGHIVENPLINAIEIVNTSVPAPPPGSENFVYVRSYDGTTAGSQSQVANPDGTTWSTARGGFWVGGTLFYNQSGVMNRRTFDGTTFGTPAVVDPYHDPLWDTILTDSGPATQTYAGVTVNFYAETPNVTSMFYNGGRIYYTLSGQSGLFWRWFSPDSGVVSPEKVTVSGANQFINAGGTFVSSDKLYIVNRTNGQLSRMDWIAGAPSGSPTVVSGPTIDGQDWRGKAVFIGP